MCTISVKTNLGPSLWFLKSSTAADQLLSSNYCYRNTLPPPHETTLSLYLFFFFFGLFSGLKLLMQTHSRVTKSPFSLPLATISGHPPSHQYTTPTFMSGTSWTAPTNPPSSYSGTFPFLVCFQTDFFLLLLFNYALFVYSSETLFKIHETLDCMDWVGECWVRLTASIVSRSRLVETMPTFVLLKILFLTVRT